MCFVCSAGVRGFFFFFFFNDTATTEIYTLSLHDALPILLLQDRGCVAPGYATGMQAREAQAETFLGHGVAIPHGRAEDRALVLRDAVAVLQVREGLDWNAGQNVHLVRSEEHTSELQSPCNFVCR